MHRSCINVDVVKSDCICFMQALHGNKYGILYRIVF